MGRREVPGTWYPNASAASLQLCQTARGMSCQRPRKTWKQDTKKKQCVRPAGCLLGVGRARFQVAKGGKSRTESLQRLLRNHHMLGHLSLVHEKTKSEKKESIQTSLEPSMCLVSIACIAQSTLLTLVIFKNNRDQQEDPLSRRVS